MPTEPADPNSRMSLWKILLPIGVILAIVLVSLFALRQFAGKAPSGGHEAQTGSSVPDIQLRQFRGKTHPLSELDKKVLVINFWATWCEACMVEMPSLVKLRSSYKDQGLEVILVNLDENPEAVVPRTLKMLGIDFPVYLDPDGELADLFDVHAIPLTAILNGRREILLIESGERDWNSDEVRSRIEGWLR